MDTKGIRYVGNMYLTLSVTGMCHRVRVANCTCVGMYLTLSVTGVCHRARVTYVGMYLTLSVTGMCHRVRGS